MTQDQALSILKTGANVFLTGEPGSGKTHTINRFVAWLREHDIQPAVTASTGIAATHINGQTIHSWSGIGIRNYLTKLDLNHITSNKGIANRVRSAKILIIDEISMLSAHTLGLVDTACRAVRGIPKPFGGLQVILVGDFFQLPPVVAREEQRDGEGELFIDYDTPQNPFAFNAPAWKALKLTTCYLSEQYRQDDPTFLALLSAIRSQSISAEHHALLQTRLTRSVAGGVTQFFSHNADVDRVNTIKLTTLPDKAHVFKAEHHGPKHLIERLMRGCLSPELLTLKLGAQVMFTKNDIMRHQFVNGTLGIVTGFSKEEGYPLITTHAGRVICAKQAEWGIEDGGKVLAHITQITLRLAWAITIHKSQGMSLDGAHMDLSNAFEYGQGYVALSRIRTLSGLSLVGFNERALKVHPDVATQDVIFKEASKKAQAECTDISSHELTKKHNEFVVACDGNVKR